jgi:amidohydrolase
VGASVEELKKTIKTSVAGNADLLISTSHDIHEHPELSFQEKRSAKVLGELAAEHGFSVSYGKYGIDTSFEAIYGKGDFRVVVCAEYDSLPNIGHACGHNIICTAALGAAFALKELADELNLTVVLLGTPAEEHGGGKSIMLDNGAWDDATISLMVHGTPALVDTSCSAVRMNAVSRFNVTFKGRGSHAAARPEYGINAGDAATLSLVAIGLMRQQTLDGVRMNAFVAHGGDETNIIPETTLVKTECRTFDLDLMRQVRQKMYNCFEGAAVATGCTWSREEAEPLYEDTVQYPALADAWDANLRDTGRQVRADAYRPLGSTDMGNVCHYLPAIHPTIAVLGHEGQTHTAQFAQDAMTPEADQSILDAARALAGSVVDVASDPDERQHLLDEQAARLPYAQFAAARPSL